MSLENQRHGAKLRRNFVDHDHPESFHQCQKISTSGKTCDFNEKAILCISRGK